jgi:hypothetical protein
VTSADLTRSDYEKGHKGKQKVVMMKKEVFFHPGCKMKLRNKELKVSIIPNLPTTYVSDKLSCIRGRLSNRKVGLIFITPKIIILRFFLTEIEKRQKEAEELKKAEKPKT